MILDTRYWLLDTRYWSEHSEDPALGRGYRMLDVGYWMLDTEQRIRITFLKFRHFRHFRL